jgi:hypothetical protein
MNPKKQTLLKFNKNLKVLLILHKHRKEKCIMVREGHVHNVKPWKTFTRGSVQDIKEGSMIAVLAIEDPHGYPSWIAKVINIEK